MSSIRELPDFIYASRLRDIFWNNNSDLYPTRVPEISLYDRIQKTRPTFLNPYLATCVITGDFNHAIYDGKYYLLTKLEVVDVKKNIYRYQMDLDIMINLLNQGGEIRGILSKTNREDILEECLQNTTPILTSPTDIKVLGFGAKRDKWQEGLYAPLISLASENVLLAILDTYIGESEFLLFVSGLRENFLGHATIGKKWLPGTFTTEDYNL